VALSTTLVPVSWSRSPSRAALRQARQLFCGLWEVVRARGLHQMAPELWAVMLVDENGNPSSCGSTGEAAPSPLWGSHSLLTPASADPESASCPESG
jgi:hypothetical protein